MAARNGSSAHVVGRAHLVGAQSRDDGSPTLSVGEFHFVGMLGMLVDVNDRAYGPGGEPFAGEVGDQAHEVEDVCHDSYLT